MTKDPPPPPSSLFPSLSRVLTACVSLLFSYRLSFCQSSRNARGVVSRSWLFLFSVKRNLPSVDDKSLFWSWTVFTAALRPVSLSQPSEPFIIAVLWYRCAYSIAVYRNISYRRTASRYLSYRGTYRIARFSPPRIDLISWRFCNFNTDKASKFYVHYCPLQGYSTPYTSCNWVCFIFMKHFDYN